MTTVSETTTIKPLRERICEAWDILGLIKISYYQKRPCAHLGGRIATHNDMALQGRVICELNNEALRKQGKRARTITAIMIANTIR